MKSKKVFGVFLLVCIVMLITLPSPFGTEFGPGIPTASREGPLALGKSPLHHMAVTLTAGLAVAPASAASMSVNLDNSIAGKPVSGSGQNLPSLGATEDYYAGAEFAPQIMHFYDAGLALQKQQEVAAAALTWTVSWLERVCGVASPKAIRKCRAMAVFDIDETLLDNYSYYVAQDPQFTWHIATWEAYETSCASPANEPVLALYDALQLMGVQIALITGRSELQRDATIACLTQRGVTGWHTLVMRKASQETMSASAYKAQARRQLVKQGWKIGPSIGDQISDMAGGYLTHGFLLPNPMYFLP
jgi:hypothetical protein